MVNFDHPGMCGACAARLTCAAMFDEEAMAEALAQLKRGQAVAVRAYDYAACGHAQHITVLASPRTAAVTARRSSRGRWCW